MPRDEWRAVSGRLYMRHDYGVFLVARAKGDYLGHVSKASCSPRDNPDLKHLRNIWTEDKARQVAATREAVSTVSDERG